jgi:hypothetical protein
VSGREACPRGDWDRPTTGKRRYQLLPQQQPRRWWRVLVPAVFLLFVDGLFAARVVRAHPCWSAAGGSFTVPIGLLDGHRMMRTQWCTADGEPAGPAVPWVEEVAP